MERDYWLRQAADKTLFPDLEWSKPQSRQAAGKLLIIGGHAHGFSAPAEAYQTVVEAGVGTAHVLLPDALQRTVGRVLENGEYAASTPSGSFNQKALQGWLTHASWADAVLLAGDLGRNSEVAVLMEKFLAKHQGQVTVTKDAVDYITSAPQTVVQRSDTTLVLSLSQLQRLAIATKTAKPVTFAMDLLHLVEWLHDFTAAYPFNIMVKHLTTIFVAVEGRVSTTSLTTDKDIWRVEVASKAAVWWVQNPSKPFEALTIACSDSL